MKKIFNRHEIKYHLEGKDKNLWEGKMEELTDEQIKILRENPRMIEFMKLLNSAIDELYYEELKERRKTNKK